MSRGIHRSRAAGPPPLRSRVRVGDWLGAYQLCAQIGQGGMARVFLAVASDRLGRRRYVAVKCLREELAVDRRFIDMFVDEVRLASQVAHPNVASAFDFGVARGGPYLVMEHLSGQRLGAVRQRLTSQPEACPPALRSGVVARLMADACEGVHAIHEARDLYGDPLNIIHRDICPSNLFVTYDGALSVLDFGVARSTGQRHTTRAGVVKGKYSYLAPELAHGAVPNRHSDIWSLGVVAWEMLTGERLFAGDTDIEVLRAIDGAKEIAAPSKVLGGGSDLIDEVLMCALSRDPAQRFDTARDFGKLLTQLLVETQQAVGMAEIAELMDQLFPRAQEETRELYDAAEALEAPLLKIGELSADPDEIPLLSIRDLGEACDILVYPVDDDDDGDDDDGDGARGDDDDLEIDILEASDDEGLSGDDRPENRPTRSLARRVVAIGAAVLLFAFSSASALDCRPVEASATDSAAAERCPDDSRSSASAAATVSL